MSGRGSGRGVFVVRPVRLPRSVPRVLQLERTVSLPPGSVNRPTRRVPQATNFPVTKRKKRTECSGLKP